MKTILIFILALYGYCACAQTVQNTNLKDSLMLKSQKQKTGGWLLMGTGIGLTVTGAIINLDNSLDNIFEENDNSITGPVLIVTGLVAIGGGVYYLISAHRNKEKAMKLALSTSTALFPVSGGWTYRMQPALKLSINLGGR